VCLGKKSRYRPPAILLQVLRINQQNRCHYNSPICKGPVECIAHLCHNPPCRNPKHLVGSCDGCNKQISNNAKAAKNRSVKESVSVETTEDQPDSLAVNREKEPQWINYYTSRLDDEHEIYQRVLSAEAVNYCNISIETDRKYRVKWVAPPDYRGPANFLFDAYREKETGKTVLRLRKPKDLDEALDLQLRKTGRVQFLKALNQ
jgi:hypothetical protein